MSEVTYQRLSLTFQCKIIINNINIPRTFNEPERNISEYTRKPFFIPS